MNILFVSYTFLPTLGGIEVNSDILARGFVEAGHSVTLITKTPPQPPFTSFPYIVVRTPSLLKTLRLALWANVIFHNNPSLRFSLVSLLFPWKLVIAVRTWIRRDDGRIGPVDIIKRWFVRLARRRIYISTAIASDCHHPGVVIGNPFRKQFRNQASAKRGRDVIFVGRLVDSKGVDVLLHAVRRLPESIRSSITVSIVGDGPMRKEYEGLAHALGLGSQVRFTGRLDGELLHMEYLAHRIHVTPSTWSEPFGNVALEGIAAGCFPIASYGGGLRDAVGPCGLLFANGDIEGLAEALLIALSPDFDRTPFDAHVAEHLAARDEAVVVKEYLQVLSSVLTARRNN